MDICFGFDSFSIFSFPGELTLHVEWIFKM